MNIKSAKKVIQAGFAFANWTEEQKAAFKVAWECMTKCEQKESGSEGLITSLRKYHQLDIYTVGDKWCIQLFDLDVDANDLNVSCIYEDSNKSLDNLLIEALEWVNRNREIY